MDKISIYGRKYQFMVVNIKLWLDKISIYGRKYQVMVVNIKLWLDKISIYGRKYHMIVSTFILLYLFSLLASFKHRQNKSQSENLIAGIFTFWPFAIASATDSIVLIGIITLLKNLLCWFDGEHALLGG
ncbi:hypothetical protein [Shewanella frigidimarina]|uniref:hypothetical protein n=1 Tax=Shewanella frigidimarina TaxID=56812 RepID=UPI003D79FA73